MVNDRINKIWSLFSPSVSLLTEIGLLVVWAFGIWQVVGGHHHRGHAAHGHRLHWSFFYGRLDSMSRIVSVTQSRLGCQAHLRHPGPRIQRA